MTCIAYLLFKLEKTLRAFELANVVNRFEKSSCVAIPFSIDNIARPTSLCCVIFARKYVLISLSLENERSPEATVTGTVSKIRNATETFGNSSCKWLA